MSKKVRGEAEQRGFVRAPGGGGQGASAAGATAIADFGRRVVGADLSRRQRFERESDAAFEKLFSATASMPLPPPESTPSCMPLPMSQAPAPCLDSASVGWGLLPLGAVERGTDVAQWGTFLCTRAAEFLEMYS